MVKINKKNARCNSTQKRVVIKEHGTEYFICKSKKFGDTLCGRSLLRGGGVDKEVFEIEESPKSSITGHKRALRELGARNSRKILRKIEYY